MVAKNKNNKILEKQPSETQIISNPGSWSEIMTVEGKKEKTKKLEKLKVKFYKKKTNQNRKNLRLKIWDKKCQS